jgi:hypothetical protein
MKAIVQSVSTLFRLNEDNSVQIIEITQQSILEWCPGPEEWSFFIISELGTYLNPIGGHFQRENALFSSSNSSTSSNSVKPKKQPNNVNSVSTSVSTLPIFRAVVLRPRLKFGMTQIQHLRGTNEEAALVK